ncbi:glycosyltransferase family 4 protein [Phenylobacterium sp.]|uniref:glycosyltransferase family 4 protein n=1 Tax=Phenylobacterium sp. TaxID=1871053 RepID=UPI0035B475D1
MRTRRPRLLYLINSFDRGGAEQAPFRLLAGGAFDGLDVEILALMRGAGALPARVANTGWIDPAPQMTLRRLAQAADALRPRLQGLDALVLALPQANLLGRLLAPTQRKPLILSFEHNTRLANRAYELGYWITSRRVDWMLSDCEETARRARARLYRRPPPRETVLPLVSFAPGRPWPLRPLANRPLELVSASRLTAAKQPGRLVGAVARLHALGRPARLTLYGDGPLRQSLEAQIRAEGLETWVRLPGHDPGWRERGPADAFVLASRHEGLCIAALEAMSVGLPVVAPAVGGLRDYGSAGGALLTSDKPADLAASVLQVVGDEAQRRHRSEAAVRLATTRYGAEQVNALYRRFNGELQAVLASRS